jgi:acyl-CoA synthetase (AMP-forming)/AMP-acid ligase II
MVYTLFDILLESNKNFKNKVAYIEDEQSFLYSQIYEYAVNLSNYIVSKGIKKGDRVLICLGNSLEFIVSFFAITRIGAIIVPANNNSSGFQLKHIIDDCNIKLAIIEDSSLKKLNDVINLDRFDYITIEKKKIIKNEFDFGKLSQELNISQRTEKVSIIESDLAVIIYTSGSTGKPKGVMLTHRNLIAFTQIVCDYLKISIYDRILCVLPFSFTYGLNQLLTSFYYGATLIVKKMFLLQEIPTLLTKYEVTGFAGIPTIWSEILNKKNIGDFKFDKLRYITNAGGKMPDVFIDKIQTIFKYSHIYLMYGLTEALRVSYLEPEKFNEKRGSIGKAIPNSEIFIINENNQLCKANECGELVFRGPTVSIGYWNSPETSEMTYRQNIYSENSFNKNEKVLFTGDLGYKDEDGYIFFVGRKNQIIKSRGYRVSPSEIEEVVYNYNAIKECAIIAIPDDQIGEKIILYYTIKDSYSKEFKINSLKKYCLDRLPGYMLPEEFINIKEFPKTLTGKVDKVLLIQNYHKDCPDAFNIG